MLYTGEWSTIQLAEPVHEGDHSGPWTWERTLSGREHFYAFSSQKGAWDVLQLPRIKRREGETARRVSRPKYISVQQGDRLYVFSLKHGKWSEGATMKLRRDGKEGRSQPRPAVATAMTQPASSRSRRSRSRACSGVSSSGSICRSSFEERVGQRGEQAVLQGPGRS